MNTVEELRKNSVIVRGHSDSYEIGERFNMGEKHPFAAWLPRLQKANVDVVWLAISGDTLCHTNGDHRRLNGALGLLDIALNDEEYSQGKMKIIRSKAELPKLGVEGMTHFILSLEGGGPLQKSLANLRQFYRLGVRVMQLTHNMRNELADGVKDDAGGRLSPFGRQVVKEMNRLGMIIDLAHISPGAFDEIVELSEYPVVYSHGNIKSVHNHVRNLTDEQMVKLVNKGGVIGILALPDYINEGIPTMEGYVNHIDYIVQKFGIEHVGIGHLGIDSTIGEIFKPVTSGHYKTYWEAILPNDIDDYEQINKLIEILLKRGYKDNDIELILGSNFLRVLNQVLK